MGQHSPRRLTEGYINGLKYDGRGFLVRDTRVVGLMVAVNKLGKSYKVQRDLWQGRRGRRKLVKTVRQTLGCTEELTLDEARLRAEDVLRQIKLGVDPNAPPEVEKSEGWTVKQLYDEYAADMRKRECSEFTIDRVLYRRDLYLADWLTLPLKELTRSIVRAKHHSLSEDRGPTIANQVMRELRAAYNLALRVVDDTDMLPDNPVKAVTFNKQRRKDAVIDPQDLPDWWQKISALPNPLRRCMHEFGLYSGLRPGTLVALRREWIRREQQALSIPKMKSGRSFDLPLSEHMLDIIARAEALGDAMCPGAPWLSPTRAMKTNQRTGVVKGQFVHIQVWRESSLPSETGHILRHTYRTIAQRIGLDKFDARLLLDHAVPGIDGVYIHEKALFDRLLAAQDKMSSELTRLTRAGLS